jgi:hypothetical protein
MSLTEVRIGEEVWLTCLSHALSTETEEVMGLLFGDIKVTCFSSLPVLLLLLQRECVALAGVEIMVVFCLLRSIRAGAG